MSLPGWKTFEFTVANIHEILEPSLETNPRRNKQENGNCFMELEQFSGMNALKYVQDYDLRSIYPSRTTLDDQNKKQKKRNF